MRRRVVRYTYKSYPNCPRATEISRSRASAKVGLSYLTVMGILCGLVLLFQGAGAGAAVLAISVALLIYLYTSYDKLTEKNINKVIAKQISTQQTLQNTRYQCDALTYLNDAGVGQCMVCYQKGVKVARYRVKRASETREIPVCEACVAKLRDSLPENAGKHKQAASNDPSTPLTPQQQALELDFVNTFLQSNSEPLGDRQEAWNWMMGKMRQFRQKGLGKQEMFALASNAMVYLTDIYSQRVPELLQVAEPNMIVAQVAKLLQENKHEKAKQIAQPFWDYFGKHQDTLSLSKDEIIILAMAVSANGPKQN